MGHQGAQAEEQELAGAFGEDFKQYAARTPRYLPRRELQQRHLPRMAGRDRAAG